MLSNTGTWSLLFRVRELLLKCFLTPAFLVLNKSLVIQGHNREEPW